MNKLSNKEVNKIFYFSEGCASQYKNCKHFFNLTHHKKNFGIKADWSLFAASCGKNSCDSIGGSRKRSVQQASLQTPQRPILDAHVAFDYCVKNVKSVTFEFLTSAALQELRSASSQYEHATTIPGTRGYHFCTPFNDEKKT